MANLLVTGHAGFVGRTLFRASDTLARPRGWNLSALPDGFDIRDPSLVARMRERLPDAVLHLAALSNVDESVRDPELTFDVNFGGTRNLLRALRDSGFSGRMVYVSSGDCYGTLDDDALPVNEDRALKPRNPYAVSKVAAEALCYQWSQTEDLDIVIARPFNHVGPGQEPRFAVASFAQQIARIVEDRSPPVVRVGNLDVTRDFTDVQDVLDAYFALLEHGRPGEVYNIGSGREVRLGDVLDALIADAGVVVEVESMLARRRGTEQRRVVADVAKIHRDTQWRAKTPLTSTLREILLYWRQQIRHE